MEVFINDVQDKQTLDLDLIQQTSLEILAAMNCDERCELSVALVDDREIHRLNLQYRSLDRATDVLSFALQEAEGPQVQAECAGEQLPLVLGDVIISIETTQKQAEEHGHNFERELLILLVHGILHLLGYDHIEDPDAEEMEILERQMLEKLRI
ncbi:MAG: rRNA maturation RNase YbeY [bacterium]|nr:rRNA maturation RNase YbeY [bacterium]